MLDFLRKNLKRFSILLWIATAAFIIGGAYLFVSGPFRMGSNTAIQVGNIKISVPEYEEAYNNIYKFYVQLLTQLKGGNITEADIKRLNIKQKTINTLIDRALLLEEAQREGIKVTKQDVVRAIESNPAFFVNGRFSKEKYLALLKANGINPKDYENGLKTMLYIDKLKKMLFKNVRVTDKEIKSFFDKNYSKVDLEFVVLNKNDFLSKVKPTEKELLKYYNEHKEKYRVPTMVKFEYVEIPLSYVEKKVKVSKTEVESFYKNHQQYFEVPLRIKIARILFKKKDNETDGELKKLAYKVYKMIKNKKITFVEAVKRYSDDKYSVKNNGDLGYITQNMVPKNFWDAVYKLKKGEISPPFKTKLGYNIVMVEDVKKPFVKKLEKVKREIVDYLKEKKAKKIWFIEADKVFVKIRDSKEPMVVIAKKIGLEVKYSPYMSLKKPLSPFTSKMVQNAIIQGKGALLGPDLSSVGYLIYKVSDEKKSYIPSFKDIETKVRKDFIDSMAEKLAFRKAETILKMAKKKRKLSYVASVNGLKLHFVKGLTKFTPTNKFPCSFEERVVDNIFSHSKGFIGLCKNDSSVYVFEVTSKIFDKKEFDKMKKSIKQQLLAQKENEILNNLLKKLRKETKIKINPKL